MIPYNYYPFFMMPFIPPNCDKPLTIYSILNSIVNGTKEPDENEIPIKDLAKYGRSTIFNFDYPLSEHIDKEDFETMILKHYMMRRIGYETVTAFRIALDSKLNEIMPLYNKMFDGMIDWNFFNDGEKTVRIGNDNRDVTNILSTTSSTSNISDRRNSELPQNQISDVQNGNYMTDYNYDTNTGSDTSNSSGTTADKNNYSETIEKTKFNTAEDIKALREIQENIKSIYTRIFEELDVLFYGLI